MGPLCIPSLAQPSPVTVSDQKAGSLLVFPYYDTGLIGGGGNKTQIAITNTSTAQNDNVTVHLFFMDGRDCTPVDFFICLTPNGSITLPVVDIDPGVKGYVIAVAVNGTDGTPIQKNVLIGNAFVNAIITTGGIPATYVGNYSAESFTAIGMGAALFTAGAGTATLKFDGLGYDPVPNVFAVQIQSPTDALNQLVVTSGLIGDMTIADPLNSAVSNLSGAAQTGTGQLFSQNEKAYSFVRFLNGSCQASTLISDRSPKVASTLSNIIKTGETGWMRFNVGGAVGLLMTPSTAPKLLSGIRTLHKLGVNTATTLTIPTFIPPTCHTLNPLVP